MKALIVRPQPAAQELYRALKNLGVASECCPVVSFQSSHLAASSLEFLVKCDIIIAVSQPAVRFTHQALIQHNNPWSQRARYLAVGSKTASCLQQLTQQPTLSPTSEDSEGLLELLATYDLKGKKVAILRGDSGRELLFARLQQLGAETAYIESYARHWTNFDAEVQVKHWQSTGIDHLIVTSFEQLKFFTQQIPTHSKNWLHSLELIVPSERVAQLALQLGFTQVRNINGASNQAIINSIQGELHRKI
ncbi:uroporphyrinogen-III synthase [Vibrio halioticoli NBRC 102217]|uniref:Uroporphyrinogen-III synthase n=1 Tax=Vibrio halioticoli NBRC 102217 TaxID=1219072 RepID=V5HNC3_9VIBR|nr:uroporphyrinogen-III synthase [Vibrio halioticoli]GAD90725.1 uroporphyrinogen-III synthase [Vibrio halioticoli NBRC 102217]